MSCGTIEHHATLWMDDDVPARMVYAAHRWRVIDTPTRVRESVWTALVEEHHGLCGWRFQASDDAGRSVVFDVYKGEDGWRVRHTWA